MEVQRKAKHRQRHNVRNPVLESQGVVVTIPRTFNADNDSNQEFVKSQDQHNTEHSSDSLISCGNSTEKLSANNNNDLSSAISDISYSSTRESYDNVTIIGDTKALDLPKGDSDKCLNYDLASPCEISNNSAAELLYPFISSAPNVEVHPVDENSHFQSLIIGDLDVPDFDCMVCKYIEQFCADILHYDDTLYELLIRFSECCDNFHKSKKTLEEKYRDLSDLISNYWKFKTCHITAAGICTDGFEAHKVIDLELAYVNECQTEELQDSATSFRQFLFKKLSSEQHRCSATRLDVDIFIARLLKPFIDNAPDDSSVNFTFTQATNETSISKTDDLKRALTTLFCFVRDNKIYSKEFNACVKQWLYDAVSVFVRYASADDHLFLLNCFLRCPSGYLDWNNKFIYNPITSDICSKRYLYHLAILFGSFLPVFQTRPFLLTHSENTSSSAWQLIGVDLEDEQTINSLALTENEFLKIFDVYKVIDLLKPFIESIISQNECTSAGNPVELCLKLSSFCEFLVSLLCLIIKDYQHSCYRTLQKACGKFVRQLIAIITSVVTHLIAGCNLSPAEVGQLMNISDSFFDHSLEKLISNAKKTLWSILCCCNYEQIYFDSTRWSILANFLSINTEVNADDVLKSSIENRMASIEFLETLLLSRVISEKMCFVSTLNRLAINCTDKHFVNVIAVAIFKMTFISDTLRNLFYLEGRRSLTMLAETNASVIGPLLMLLCENIESLSSYFNDFIDSVPLKLWVPGEDEFLEFLDRFYLAFSDELHFNIFCELISAMNWEGTGEISCHLPLTHHEAMALCLLKLSCTLEGVSSASPDYGFTEISLPSWIIGNKKTEVITWIWSVILRLNLHRATRNFTCFSNMVNRKPSDVPSINTDGLKYLKASLDKGSPLACYLALQMTNVGHDSRIFLESGVNYFKNLVDAKCFDAAVVSIVNLTPILIIIYPYIDKEDPFLLTLSQLLNYDHSYLKYVSDYIYRVFCPGSSVSLLSHRLLRMLIFLEPYHEYRVLALMAWISMIVKLESWKRSQSMCFILEKLLTHSFIYDLGISNITNLFFVQAADNANNRLTKIFNWFSTSSSASSFCAPFIDINYPFLTFTTLSAYENQFKMQFDVALGLMYRLFETDPSIKVADAWKDVAVSIEVADSFRDLPVFLWCRVAKSVKPECPLNVLFWQKFFQNYISPLGNSQRLFSDVTDVTLLKQCKQSLLDCLKYYRNLSTNSSDDLKQKYARLCDLYFAFSLWIDEPRLHDNVVDLENFPKQYECILLRRIIDNQHDLWTEFIDFNELYESLNLPLHSDVDSRQTVTNKVDIKRSLFDLFSNEHSISEFPSLPSLCDETTEFLCFDVDKKNCLSMLKTNIGFVSSYIASFALKAKQYESMDLKLLNCLSVLWRNDTSTRIVDVYCSSSYNPLHSCSGPAYVRVSAQSKTKNPVAQHEMDDIRKSQRSIRKEILNNSSRKFACCLIKMNLIVNYMTQTTAEGHVHPDVGSQAFFMLFNHFVQIGDYFSFYKEALVLLIHKIGKVYIDPYPNSQEQLLQIILSNKKEYQILIEHFIPSSSRNDYPVLLEKIRPYYACCDRDLIFSLLKKFDIASWVKNASTDGRLALLHSLLNFLYDINDPLADGASNPVLQPLLIAFEQILTFKWPSLFGRALHFLLNACGSTPCVPSVTWSALANAISTNELTPQSAFESFQLKNLMIWMGSLFRSRRNILTNFRLYNSHVPYCDDIHKVLHILVLSYLKRLYIKGSFHEKKAVSDALHDAYSLYSPWIEPLLIENHLFVPFIESEYCHASTFLNGFVNVFNFAASLLKQYENLRSWIAEELIYHMYLLFSAHLSTEFYFNSWLSALESFDWNDVILDSFGMEHLVNLSKYNSPSVVQLALCLTNNIQWSKQFQSVQHDDTLCRHILSLFVHLSTSPFMPVVEPVTELDALLSLIENYIDWQHLSAESFSQVIIDVKQNVKWKFLFASKVSSDGYAMRALKYGCEFKIKYASKTVSKCGQSKRIKFIKFVNDLMTAATGREESEIIVFVKNILSEIESLLIYEYCSAVETEELINELFRCAEVHKNRAPTIYVSLYDWLDTYNPLVIPILRAACRNPLDINRKVLFVETCVTAYFSELHSSEQEGGWKIIFDNVQLNLHSNDLPCSCVANRSFLVLYVWFKLLFTECESDIQKAVAVLSQAVTVLDMVHLLSKKEEEKFILIICKMIRAVNSLARESSIHDLQLTEFNKNFVQWLIKLKENASMKSSLFQFNRSENCSPLFALFCASVAASISLTYLCEDAGEKVKQKALSQYKECAAKKCYAEFLPLIAHLNENLDVETLDINKLENLSDYFIINAFSDSVLLQSSIS